MAQTTTTVITTIICGNKSKSQTTQKRRKPLPRIGLDKHVVSIRTIDDITGEQNNQFLGKSEFPDILKNRDATVALCFTYLGDAIWELFARQHLVLRAAKKRNDNSSSSSSSSKNSETRKTLRPQKSVQDGWCSAIAMHSHLDRLIKMDILTKEEIGILKWGADYGHESRMRHSGVEHRDASALEALVAYLFIFDSERLLVLLDAIGMTFMGKVDLVVRNEERRREACVSALDDIGFIGEGSKVSSKSNSESNRDSGEDAVVSSSGAIAQLTLENDSLKKEVEELKQKALMAQRAVRLKRI